MIEFERVKGLVRHPLILCLAVGSVNLQQTVVPNVIDLLVLKDDLHEESIRETTLAP